MGEVFGYARVSTSDQNAQLQIDELRDAGCGRILVETAPGAGERPELVHLMDLLRPGDTVGCGDSTVWAVRSRTSSNEWTICVNEE